MRFLEQSWLLFGFCLWFSAAALAQDPPAPASSSLDLTSLTLEQLLRIHVTSVSKKPEDWWAVPAAVSVITDDQTQRSGATSLPAALRLAPGLNIGQVSSYQWAVASRGFADMFSRMLLVMRDGRTLYTHLYSGVLWEMQDLLLEDIEVIEVVRGPNAALWGANAVNGVIDITTKSTRDTQGLLLTTGLGTELQAFGALRYGGQVAEDLYYKAYVKAFQWDDLALSNKAYVGDAWWQTRGGAQVDWYPQADTRVLFQGELYTGRMDATVRNSFTNPPYAFIESSRAHIQGGHLLARWQRDWDEANAASLQTYYNHYERKGSIFQSTGQTFDIETQLRLPLGQRQKISWGLNYRYWWDQTEGSKAVSFSPANDDLHLFGTYLRDEITLWPDRLRLILGTRLEHNPYTDWEFQPAARLAWTPTRQQTWWAAVSRAVRIPARADTGLRIEQNPVPPGIVPVVNGNPDQRSETVLAYELGWRIQPHRQLSSDLALFYNVYDHVRSLERQGLDFGATPPELVIVAANNLAGESYGAEWTGRWEPRSWWRLELQYSALQMQLRPVAGSNDPSREENAPRHQVSLRSGWDLPHGWLLDGWLRWVDGLPAYEVPSYWSLDLRLAWRPSPHWELAVVGQNLLDSPRTEFPPSFTHQSTEVQRGFYGKLTVRF